MSFGTNATISTQNINNTKNNEPSRIPRWFTQEGQAHLAQLRAKYQTTPQDVYCVNQSVVGMYSSNSCSTCVTNTSYVYQSGSAGGSPY